MILPYGPVPLTAGIVTSQDVDSSAAWVVVENVSTQLYLGVSFWPSKPPAVTVFNGQPWNAVIQPGGTQRIQTPAVGWLGRIWLLGVDASAQSAATGTISGYSSALLRTYGPGDTPSDSPAVVRGFDILSQTRTVVVPTSSISRCDSGSGETFASNPALVLSGPPSANQLANQVINVYLYAHFGRLAVDAAANTLTYNIECDAYDSVGASIIAGPLILGHFLAQNAAATPGPPVQWYPFMASSASLVWASGTPDTIRIWLRKISSAGVIALFHNSLIDIDFTNRSLPTAIGRNPLPTTPTSSDPHKF